jgi:small GTP-binding protein
MVERNCLAKEFHVAVLGSSAVGKTSLIQQYVKSCFPEDYKPTYTDTYHKELSVGNLPCLVEIIDTAGQEHNSAQLNALISKADAFLLVFDITYSPSFGELQNFRERVMDVKASQRARQVSYVLVGNKLDLDHKRAVTQAEALALAAKWGIKYIETSARSKDNLDFAFSTIIRLLMKSRVPAQSERPCCLVI